MAVSRLLQPPFGGRFHRINGKPASRLYNDQHSRTWLRKLQMACPFFLPVERIENGNWMHPARLPLGCGWSGRCTAPGHDGETPDSAAIEKFCNLGYASGCGNLPSERAWDAVRFGVNGKRLTTRNDELGHTIEIRYVCERNHLPAEHGTMEFDLATSEWTRRHADPRIQAMADSFLRASLTRNAPNPGPTSGLQD